MLTLLGVAVVVAGFAARLNPMLVVAVAAIVTGLAAHMHPLAIVASLGHAFTTSRYVGIVWLVLPVIGLLEHAGLRERAQTLIARVRAATAGRVLLLYFIVRQITAALGLTAIGGQAQMVRPLIAPMAEAAAEADAGPISEATREHVRAHAAGVDNVAAFFGEDIFLAVASILLIKGFLQQNGIIAQPLQLSVWAIPTALLALLIHGTRLMLLDRRLRRLRSEAPRTAATRVDA